MSAVVIDHQTQALVLPLAPELPGVGLATGQAPFQFDEADRVAFGKRQRDRAIQDAIRAKLWPEAYAAWIAGGWKHHGKTVSAQTRRAYERSIIEFTQHLGTCPLWRAEGRDVIGWQNTMRAGGLKEATINLRLSGLSSLYEFCMSKFSYADPMTGETAYLIERNPVDACNRAKVEPYKSNKAAALEFDQFKAILNRIDRSTLEGLRDYALLITLFLSGQRSAAIGNLKWGDIEHPTAETKVIKYRWTSKAKEGIDELLSPAYDALVVYLKAAGRLETIQADDYIFVALSDSAYHLDRYRAERYCERMGMSDEQRALYLADWEHQRQGRDRNRPLTGARINVIVKNAARRAGINEALVHTHTLRHSAAVWMKRNGRAIDEISRALHHSNVNTTMIYLKAVEYDRHPMWVSVGQFFDMDK